MKHILLILSIIFTNILFAQNHDALLGTWQKQTDNQIFRIELQREYSMNTRGEQASIITGHFQIIEVDSNGNETILLNSDRLVNPNNPNGYRLPPAIRGGVHNYDNNNKSYYHFLFTDNTVNKGPEAELYLQFINDTGYIGDVVQLKWRMSSVWHSPDRFNVPMDAILTRVE